MNKTTLMLIAGLTVTMSAKAADAPAAAADAPKTSAPAAKPGTIPAASTKQGLTFDKDIKPMFEASCIRCHGAQKPKGNLRLDTRENVLKGGEEGKVLVVGDGAKSKLVASIARINPKTAMPPEQRQRGPRGPGGPGGERPNREAATAGAEPAAKASATATVSAGGATKTAEATATTGNERPAGPGGRGPAGPPPKPLTAEEVGIVRAWIDQGAK